MLDIWEITHLNNMRAAAISVEDALVIYISISDSYLQSELIR